MQSFAVVSSRDTHMLPRHRLGRAARRALLPAVVLLSAGCLGEAHVGSGSGSGGREQWSGGALGSGGLTGAGGAGGAAGAGGTSNPSSRGGDQGSGGQARGGAGGISAAGGASAGAGGAGGSIRAGGRGGGTAGVVGGAAGSGGAGPLGGNSDAAAPLEGGWGGRAGSGGVSASSGSAAGSGGAGAGGATSPTSGDCTVTVTSGAISPTMPTVGVVEWTTTLAKPSSATVVYALQGAAASVLNRGGTAPVDLQNPGYRTLLLGLKPSSTYTYHVEVEAADGASCVSAEGTLKTGTLSGAPTVTRTATNPSSQAVGFIVTSAYQMSMGGGTPRGAFIIDADGTVVWYADSPTDCSRAHMDYEGANMWMLALNVMNGGGEMRFVSMDGKTVQKNVSGLSGAHHDFTVLPGKIAALVWAGSGSDPESNLVERAADGSGSNTTVFKIGANLYAGGQSAFGGGGNTYHVNSIVYHAADDTFTLGDRNPNLYVKVTRAGAPVWQIGGSCTGAKAPRCATGAWKINHGHDFDENGNLLLFNNGQSGASHVLELKLSEAASALSYTTVKDFTSGSTGSSVLGDVQRLPNGNTLITYSAAGQILEVDPSWKTVQTLKVACGYADWRPTLYGPPVRL